MLTVDGAPRGHAWSAEVRVAFAPLATYHELIAETTRLQWGWALARPLLTLLVIAVVVPIISVQRVTVSLVATSAMAWSFVVALQVAAAIALGLSVRSRPVDLPRAVDLWFAASLPYAAWMLSAAAFVAATRWSGSLVWLLASALPSLVWTTALGVAYCRAVLDVRPSGAAWRMALYQLGVFAVVLTFESWAAGGWFNVAGSILAALR